MKSGEPQGAAMITQITNMTDISRNDCYQLISQEQLAMKVISCQLISSSRILKSKYEQVVFSDCNFYACEFQGVTFENCVFDNCIFEFSHFRHSHFKNCNFNNCKWQASSSIDSVYMDCDLDQGLGKLCHNGKNIILQQDHDHTTDIYIELVLVA
jgi:uncharacterized protein YjbI with pentapeptide repeats